MRKMKSQRHTFTKPLRYWNMMQPLTYWILRNILSWRTASVFQTSCKHGNYIYTEVVYSYHTATQIEKYVHSLLASQWNFASLCYKQQHPPCKKVTYHQTPFSSHFSGRLLKSILALTLMGMQAMVASCWYWYSGKQSIYKHWSNTNSILVLINHCRTCM